MPVYPATLQHIPILMEESVVLLHGRQLRTTLQNIHRRKYGHNDVKAANMFVSATGEEQLTACTYPNLVCVPCFINLGFQPPPYWHKLVLVACFHPFCAFINSVHAGECILGDFGSALRLGQHTHEHTATHWPAEFESTSLSLHATSAAVDFFQLAVTLLERTGRYVLTDNPKPARCQEAINRLQNAELRSFVLEHLQPQD